MAALTGKERIGRIFRREPVDRVGYFEHFWNDTRAHWIAQGHLRPDEEMDDHFNFDMTTNWAAKLAVDPDFVPVTVEETEDTILQRDGNGALLRRHKEHDTTPEHVGYAVSDRAGWEEVKPRLVAAANRLNLENYRAGRERCRQKERFFFYSGVNVFEAMHPLVGHENMLLGMALDPDWIKDMADTYAGLIIDLMEMLFSAGGAPDGIWFYDDMGFKGRPFMSPAMYEELLLPAQKRTVDYAHSRKLPVVLHSCGFVEPLLPGIVRAGFDCLQVIEIKAGMDLLRIKKQYGDKLVLCGGIDTRILVSNDLAAIDRELESKIPEVKKDSGYILHSDHSIPITCRYETYRHFRDKGLELGQYPSR